MRQVERKASLPGKAVCRTRYVEARSLAREVRNLASLDEGCLAEAAQPRRRAGLFHDLRILWILAAKEPVSGQDELVGFLRPEFVTGIRDQEQPRVR